MNAAATTVLTGLVDEVDQRLAASDAALEAGYGGERGVRQPVHTCYVSGDRWDGSTSAAWGKEASGVLEEHVSSGADLAAATGISPDLADAVLSRVLAKLTTEPVEDLRIDFEDGYGSRTDEEEDGHVTEAARMLASAVREGTATPYHGIRFKSFEAATRRRGLRTLGLFVGEMARAGAVSDGLLLTLPKVTALEQVEAMVLTCDRLEVAYDLPQGRLRFEIQVETPQSILGADGTVLVARMIHAAGGRCSGLHYGTYDYSASCGISAAYQSMEHPAADYAKAVMQVAAAGTGVFISDGSTNVLPVGDTVAVLAAWRLHTHLVRRSLERGYYQGWDLHPAQLPTRFAATYAFYREGLASAASRLRAYVHGGDSGYLDEPASAAALAGFVLRGVECGAVDASEVDTLAHVDRDRLASLARRSLPTG